MGSASTARHPAVRAQQAGQWPVCPPSTRRLRCRARQSVWLEPEPGWAWRAGPGRGAPCRAAHRPHTPGCGCRAAGRLARTTSSDPGAAPLQSPPDAPRPAIRMSHCRTLSTIPTTHLLPMPECAVCARCAEARALPLGGQRPVAAPLAQNRQAPASQHPNCSRWPRAVSRSSAPPAVWHPEHQQVPRAGAGGLARVPAVPEHEHPLDDHCQTVSLVPKSPGPSAASSRDPARRTAFS